MLLGIGSPCSSGSCGCFPAPPPIPARSASCSIARLLALAWRCPLGAPPVCVHSLCLCPSHAVCVPPLSLVTSSIACLSPRREVTERSKRRSRPASHPLESVRCLLSFSLIPLATSAAVMCLLACLHLLYSAACAAAWPTRGPSFTFYVCLSHPRPFLPGSVPCFSGCVRSYV